MNKLKEYRDKQADSLVERSRGESNSGDFKSGFDAAIALYLPVKFAEWFNSKESSWKEWRREHFLLEGYELRRRAYQYWLENIYKPE